MSDDQNFSYPLSLGMSVLLREDVLVSLVLMSCRHMLFITEQAKETISASVDRYGDSYTRDVTVNELKQVSLIRQCLQSRY